MPSTGTPCVHTASGARGVSPSVTLFGPAREDDALRRELAHEVVADVVRMDLAVDVRLAQAARDELRVLRAEVEDQDPGVGRCGHRDQRIGVEPRRGRLAPAAVHSTR